MKKTLIDYTACEIVDLLYRKEVGPIELIKAMQERISVCDPVVNAVIEMESKRAEEKARVFIRPKGKKREGHLYGLPLLAKGLVGVEGFKHTKCSLAHENRRAIQSDWHAKHLENSAGGIIVGLTNAPEFGSGGNTFNALYGQTRNPWNTAYNSGGSSGGCAAALATGEAWLTDGSDYAGSIRLPASHCGIVGLRPSPGLVPLAVAQDLPAVIGPMARNVEDTALMMDALSHQHPGDEWQMPVGFKGYRGSLLQSEHPKRICVSLDQGFGYMDPEVARIFHESVAWFNAQGSVVEAFPLDFAEIYGAWKVVRCYQFAKMVREEYFAHPELIKPDLRTAIEVGLKVKALELMQAEGKISQFKRKYLEVMQEYDMLLTPTCIVPPQPCEIEWVKVLGNRALEDLSEWLVFTWNISLMGAPAISVPSGFSAKGLPIGMQMVGKHYQEAKLLGYVHRYEQAHSWHTMVPFLPKVHTQRKAA